MSGPREADSLLVMARRDPAELAGLPASVWLRRPEPAPEWAEWLAGVQRVALGEPQLAFWVGETAEPSSYVVDFDAGGDPPGYRGIWRVLDNPLVASAQGPILLARRVLFIEGRRLGSNQAWRRAVGQARAALGDTGRWTLQAFAEAFLQRHKGA